MPRPKPDPLSRYGLIEEVELAESASPNLTPPVADNDSVASAPADERSSPFMAAAYVPFSYAANSRQRIEIYRKLAQATEQSNLEVLTSELRDRFGPVPPALDLLLKVAELRILAAELGVTHLEVKDGKLMLTRHNDFVMVGSKFPRLVAKSVPARLQEIKRFLAAL